MTEKQRIFIEAALKAGIVSNNGVVTRKDLKDLYDAGTIKWPSWLGDHRVGRGEYRIPADMIASVGSVDIDPNVVAAAAEKVESSEPDLSVMQADVANSVEASGEDSKYNMSLIPSRTPGYVPFGNYSDIKRVIEAKIFYPLFVTGMSGNGKTLMVQEIAAELKRDYVRVNFTEETDESDLIGGFRLEADGSGGTRTVWHDGPVVEAMERGAILLLDEVDYASYKILSLQSVLEGKPLFLKKIGRMVHPAPGFNIIATANTKGRGDDTGRYVGASVMNDAFLERFPVTFEQDYPSVAVERKILEKHLALLNKTTKEDKEFADVLATWADQTRKTFAEGGIDELVTTRRNVFITEAYAIFGDREKAIKMNLSRFDAENQASMFDLYRALSKEKEASEDQSTSADNTAATNSTSDDWWSPNNA